MSNQLDPDIFVRAAEFLDANHDWHSQYTCNIIETVCRGEFGTYSAAESYLTFYRDLFDVDSETSKACTFSAGHFWPELKGGEASDEQLHPIRVLALCLAAAVVEYEQDDDDSPSDLDYSLPPGDYTTIEERVARDYPLEQDKE